MAMDPECFAPDFCERLQTMMDELRSFKPVSLPVCLSVHPCTLVCASPDMSMLSLCAGQCICHT